ncbi:MAG: hypothetical protein HC811_01445 [Flammeovirgaceae bacterium]|nr:hypothetical protein [Flammeovirgaceae bacterium]
MRQSGINVSLYSEGEVITNFVAIGNPGKTESYIMEVDVPEVVVIPGYRVYVNYVFELPEYAWKQKRIFDFNWRNFKSLQVSFSEMNNDGFTIELDGGYFDITGSIETDTTRLNDFLDAVSLLEADEAVSEQVLNPDLALMDLTVQDISGRTLYLHVQRTDNPQILIGHDGRGNFYRFRKVKIDAINHPKKYFERNTQK